MGNVNLKIVYIVLISLAFIIVLSLFVWLTRYEYVEFGTSGGGKFPVRINRLTGSSEILIFDRWRPIEDSSEKKSKVLYKRESEEKYEYSNKESSGVILGPPIPIEEFLRDNTQKK